MSVQSPDSDRVVLVEQRGPVRLLTMNRPQKRNALSKALNDTLIADLHAADDDPDTTVILLTGAGGAFCAGADLKDLAERGFDGSAAPGDHCIAHIAVLKTPVIGLVDGPCVTGGLEVALACDFLIAAPTARFADTHSRVGVVPGGGMTARLAESVGVRRARQMSSTGMYVDATTALDWGLVNEIVAVEALIERGWEIGAAMNTADRPTLEAVWGLYDDASADVIATAVAREAEVNLHWTADALALMKNAEKVKEHGRSQTGVGL
ncbi:MAG: enoyl-CoA hydratase/isomerase family protein [Pseudonocardiales bacterium]|nr:enoyl-CoA hydratase/isomerase family protein [Pseudonocardiales bacterium]